MVRERKTGGFTLIELLVVVAIIALLVSIMMPALQGVRRRAKSVICMTRQKAIHLGMACYAVDNDDWLPTMIETWEDETPTFIPYWWLSMWQCCPIGVGLLYPRDSETLEITGDVYVDSLSVLYGCPSVVDRFDTFENEEEFINVFMRYGHTQWINLWGMTDDMGLQEVNLEKSKRHKMSHPPGKSILVCRHIWGVNEYREKYGESWHARGKNQLGFNRLRIGGDSMWVPWDPLLGRYWWDDTEGDWGMAQVPRFIDELMAP